MDVKDTSVEARDNQGGQDAEAEHAAQGGLAEEQAG